MQLVVFIELAEKRFHIENTWGNLVECFFSIHTRTGLKQQVYKAGQGVGKLPQVIRGEPITSPAVHLRGPKDRNSSVSRIERRGIGLISPRS